MGPGGGGAGGRSRPVPSTPVLTLNTVDSAAAGTAPRMVTPVVEKKSPETLACGAAAIIAVGAMKTTKAATF